MRNLEVLTSTNLAGSKEFNKLHIPNLDEFLEGYGNKYDYYKSPFAILADLESKVMYMNTPDECILISYKEFGDIIFNFVEMYEEDDRRVIIYEYSGAVS